MRVRGGLQRAPIALLGLFLTLSPASPARQNGDVVGEDQPPLPAELRIPPAPARTPAEQQAGFQLPPGFEIELVAAEPLVHDPVAMAFDERGRLWVVEMRSYMPNADGEGEREALGSIAVLEDEDGDGRMDKRQVFVPNLVLPRALAVVAGGALVIAPPNLIYYEDCDGDGVADKETLVDSGLAGIHSPEHAINGLLPTLDNYYQCANQGVRYKLGPYGWQSESTGGGGQWGITKDDLGRIFFNTNSDPLRADCLPSQYLVRNQSFGRAPGGNTRVVRDRSVWPARITPGVNRGYQPATLRDDYTLRNFTGACGPHIYRGGAFPDSFRGDAFVCEPCGNLVKRFRLREDENGRLHGENAYQGREFLTSTDERFRPVQLADGPDGALYIVDMYRGLIQHRIFLTSFLRSQVEARGLEKPIGLGRIWRVRHEESPASKGPDLAGASWTELAQTLGHADGWWRDTVQRLIVEEGTDDGDAIELVRLEALEGEQPLGRMHALWALEGIDGLDQELLATALGDTDERVRLAAVRLSERWLVDEACPLLDLVQKVGEESQWAPLRNQVLLSLGEANTEPADRALAALIGMDCENSDRRGALLSGLAQRELEFLEGLIADPAWANETPGRRRLLHDLAACVARERRSERLARLLDLFLWRGADKEWQSLELMAGLLAARPMRPDGTAGRFTLSEEHPQLARLLRGEHEGLQVGAQKVDAAVAWPGRKGIEAAFLVRALSAGEQESYSRGRTVYTELCASCHQASGRGDPGKAPPLRGSEFVLGSERRLATILLRGLEGRLEISGGVWDMEMPAFVAGDQEIADVMTYIRREWGHGVEPVEAKTVATERALAEQAGGPLTVEKLRQIER